MIYVRKKLMMAALALIVLTAGGCSIKQDKDNNNNIKNSEYNKNLESENMELAGKDQLDDDEDNITPVIDDDRELEETLAAYRKERETMVATKMGNGLKGYGAPNPEDYGIDDNGTKYLLEFDSRETAKAYETSENYVKETLGVKTETKVVAYMCVDPRIYKIYEDEDKGVAKGYDNDDIFITEYYDGENWQYLILVRDSKGEPWNVIHHGSSYKNK